MTLVNPIKIAFGATGDKDTIVGTSTDTGVVNWDKGFPAKYSQSISSGGKFVRRQTFNGILNYISAALQYFQKGGLALFNTAFTEGGGTYSKDSALWFYNTSKNTWQLVVAQENTAEAPSAINVSRGTPWKPYTLLSYVQSKLTIQEDLKVSSSLEIGGNLKLTGSNVTATGCPTPTGGNHFANKEYVDLAISNAHAPVAGGAPGSKLINIAGFKIEFGTVSINRTAEGATATVSTLIENPLGSVATPRWYGGGDDMDFGFGCRATSNSLKISYAGRYVWNIGGVNDNKVDYIVFGT